MFLKTLQRDLKFLKSAITLKLRLRSVLKDGKHTGTITRIFARNVQLNPNKTLLYFEDKKWSFQDVDKFSNKIAGYFRDHGYKTGDTVALYSQNRPEFVGVWLGLAKIGVLTAFINNNLVEDVLIHSIKAAEVKAVIFDSDLKEAIVHVSGKIPKRTFYELSGPAEKSDPSGFAIDLKNATRSYPDSGIVEDGRASDKLMLIYTSGTTGLPKPAIFSHKRFITGCMTFYTFSDLNPRDIIYNSLPLYHSAGIGGVGMCLINGSSCVIIRKFSAKKFWSDCVKYKCTVFQYIGEICRYVLAAHRNSANFMNHNIKKILGNGLRAHIWKDFVSKFKIGEVYEFYGATESNILLVNIDSEVGAIGFSPRWLPFVNLATLIKCDAATGLPVKGKDGFYERCRCGEPGLALKRVDLKKNPGDFDGYVDRRSTETKLLRNVFQKGDVYFNSGDIMVQDELGYYYFRDRVGDTFRWKGENVATSEVESVLVNILNLNDAIVYGVEVPGTEGKAGMAAIVDTSNTLDLGELASLLRQKLPSYSVPLFVRVVDSLPMTGTFKLKKTDLQREGFNVGKIQDKIFFYDSKLETYVRLTPKKYDDILREKIRL